MTARECAYVSLKRYENSKKYLNIEGDSTIKREKLEGADKGLYTALFYGTVERKITLDHILSQLCDRPLSDIDENVLIILRMSIYQLFFMDRVPDYAILNDAGNLTKRFAAQSAVGFVNGVLRQAIRKKDAIAYPDKHKDPIAYLSVTYAYPAWLCRRWQRAYGMRTTEAIFTAFDENPPMTLRVNTLKNTREEVLARLKAEGIAAQPTVFSPFGVRLRSHVPLSALTVLSDGSCFVQDESSQISMAVFDATPGERVMDACACPGGKSFSAALMMENNGSVQSFDLHANKLSLIEKEAKTLGITIIKTAEQNGSVFVSDYENAFDRVLCDVPCSGLGVLAKKPDIRHKTEEELARLPEIQFSILENCARYVKPGGVLQYSTCTLNPAENEDIVTRFLSSHDAYTLCPFSVGTKDYDGILTLFPHRFRCDGFFIAKFRRK